MKKCVIWGIGSMAKIAQEIAYYNNWEISSYCDKRYKENNTFGEFNVISPKELEELCNQGKIDTVLIGVIKQEFVNEIKAYISSFINVGGVEIFTLRELRDIYETEYLVKKREEMTYNWEIDFENQICPWVNQIYTEVDGCVREAICDDGVYHKDYMDNIQNNSFTALDSDCLEIAEWLSDGDTVIDFGCCNFSKYGNVISETKKINLIMADGLAPFWNEANEKYYAEEIRGRKIKFALFEFAANFFEKNYADAIMISNALDHGIDPFKSILECLYIIKTGGKLYLKHRRAEALFECYTGLHKWNIDYDENDNLIIWNEKNAINVTEEIKEIADVCVRHTDDIISRLDSRVIVEITKKKDFDFEKFFDWKKESKMLAGLLEEIMCMMAKKRSYLD